MKRYLIAVCLLAGCASSQTLSGPGVTAALGLPLIQFNGATVLARDVTAGCNQYRVSDRRVAALTNARADAGNRNFGAIDTEVDVATRSFQAKHGITVGQDNTCAAIAAELAEGTALSAFIVPA